MYLNLDNSVDSFASEIKSLCDINSYDCYQCGKCSAGCAVSKFTVESPTKILRLIQLNQKEAVLKSQTPYLCASCNTCSVRCPMEIDVARLMETIRILGRKEGVKSPVKEVPKFSDAFLSTVRLTGRSYELGLTLLFNLKNRTPLKDAGFGLPLLTKRKLSILPHTIKNRKRIERIFDKSGYFEPKEEKAKKEH